MRNTWRWTAVQILLLGLVVLAVLDQDCPNSWRMNRYNDYCYGYFKDPLDYHHAKNICAEHGAILTTAKDPAELTFIMSIARAVIWLGISDAAEEGIWVFSDGEVANWTNWGSGEPNNNHGDEDCAMIYVNEKWNDVPCSSTYFPFTCKKPKSECLPTFYGLRCEFNCSIKCENQLCNSRTGVCEKCPLGKLGNQCEKDVLSFAVNDDNSVVVRQGDDVTFLCSVATSSSYNTTTVLVENGFGNITARPAGRNYTLENLSCEDSGRYTCKAVNILDPSSRQPSKSVDVNIICPIGVKDPVPDGEVRTFNSTPGNKMNISFEVYGYPPPTDFRLGREVETDDSSSSRLRRDMSSRFSNLDNNSFEATFAITTPPYGMVNVHLKVPPTRTTIYLLTMNSSYSELSLEFKIDSEDPQPDSPEQTRQSTILIIGFSGLGVLLMAIIIMMMIYCHLRSRQGMFTLPPRVTEYLPGLQNEQIPMTQQETRQYLMHQFVVGQPTPPGRAARPEYFDGVMNLHQDYHEYVGHYSVPNYLRPTIEQMSEYYDDAYTKSPYYIKVYEEEPEYLELDGFQRGTEEDEGSIPDQRELPDGGTPEDDGYENPVVRNRPGHDTTGL